MLRGLVAGTAVLAVLGLAARRDAFVSALTQCTNLQARGVYVYLFYFILFILLFLFYYY